MKFIKTFLTLTGYQLTWLACVFGQIKFNQPSLGLYVGLIYLIIYFYFSKNKINLIKVCLYISLPGYFFDTLMVYFSVYNFNVSHYIGLLPGWMFILWLSFSTLFDEILIFFKKYKLIGILLSGLLGPITYYIGLPLGLINIDNTFIFFILMSLFWCLLMLFYLEIVLKNYSIS